VEDDEHQDLGTNPFQERGDDDLSSSPYKAQSLEVCLERSKKLGKLKIPQSPQRSHYYSNGLRRILKFR